MSKVSHNIEQSCLRTATLLSLYVLIPLLSTKISKDIYLYY